ncbi:anthranilate synthase component I family protein [Chitinophagaceae bacterium LWZ2-11]
MKRSIETYSINNAQTLKKQMLNWCNRFNICVFLDNHHYTSSYSSIECIAAAGAINTFVPATEALALKEFKEFCAKHKNDWLFGHVAYDFKNTISPGFSSSHFDGIKFENILFFQPEVVLKLSANSLIIESLTQAPDVIYKEITAQDEPLVNNTYSQFNITPRISKADYIETIKRLKQHILRGDCYEINFCQEFYAENVVIDANQVYDRLTNISPNPFACFYKANDKYLLCASPERYLKKTGNKIISQPIKGTNKRDLQEQAGDEKLKQELYNSTKDRSENVMVVDLVRNDLSRVCKQGTVHVEELFGIYTFPQVHQMISTIAGELKDDIDFADILQATFPMGSMTGAPKKKVIELTEQYEQSKRGLYAGTVGYINPDNDFDFNVVIRSIQYNATNKYLSYQVGGGITYNSDPKNEYEECLLKAEAMRKVLAMY